MDMDKFFSRIDERIKKEKALKNSPDVETSEPKTHRMAKPDYHPVEYPLVIKAHQNMLVFSMPDFQFSHVVDLPKTGFDPKYLQTVATNVAKSWLKAQERIKTLKEYKSKVPAPTLIKDVLKRNGKKKLTVPQVAILLSKSQMTVRRMADRGDIPCYKSSGGTRYFYEKDIIKLMNL